MFTPEEVIAPDGFIGLSDLPAAVVNLGKTAWLRSFTPTHLANCDHYRALFYDECLDVICEGITAEDGTFQGEAGSSSANAIQWQVSD